MFTTAQWVDAIIHDPACVIPRLLMRGSTKFFDAYDESLTWVVFPSARRLTHFAA